MIEQSTNDIIEHIEGAGKDELHALKPMVAAIVRKFIAQYEATHMTGLIGKVERRIVDSVIDSIFGVAPEQA